ncbi:MAG: hypothetical protein H0X30_07670 [Anaerolineae bacterium]|nr:hypothetical protein [Anaerolineae bacterium]
MKLQRRKILFIFLFVVILVFIPVFWAILSIPSGEGSHENPIWLTVLAIETQNKITEGLLQQTQIASPEGIGQGLREWSTMTPITPTVTPAQS